MKDETIRVGDLVMVIRPRICGCHETVGRSFTVASVSESLIGGSCFACNKLTFPPGSMVAGNAVNNTFTQLSRLLKINPPAVDETVETSDEVTV